MNNGPHEISALHRLREDAGPGERNLARVERELLKEYRTMSESVLKRHAAAVLLAVAGVGICSALAGAASYRWWERNRVVTDEPAGEGRRHLRIEDSQGRVIMDGLVGEDEEVFIAEPGAQAPDQASPKSDGSGDDEEIFEMLEDASGTGR